jgi:hypothetical protein
MAGPEAGNARTSTAIAADRSVQPKNLVQLPWIRLTGTSSGGPAGRNPPARGAMLRGV